MAIVRGCYHGMLSGDLLYDVALDTMQARVQRLHTLHGMPQRRSLSLCGMHLTHTRMACAPHCLLHRVLPAARIPPESDPQVVAVIVLPLAAVVAVVVVLLAAIAVVVVIVVAVVVAVVVVVVVVRRVGRRGCCA